MLPRGYIDGLSWAILQGDRCKRIAPLHPIPSVRGEEPHPMRGDPIVQNAMDRKE
jgi:hypothetical protein